VSREARDWVWDEAPVEDPRRLLILLSLADVADEWGGGAYPSVERMAKDSRSGVRTVQRHLGGLLDEKVLEIEAPAVQHKPTTYRFRELFERSSQGRQTGTPGQRQYRGQGRHMSDTPKTPRGVTGVPSDEFFPLLEELEERESPKRARCLSESFALTDEMREWCRAEKVAADPERETQKFRDYWLSNGKRKIDWIATWRNWMRRADEFAGARRNGNGHGSYHDEETEVFDTDGTLLIGPAARGHLG
jgi:Helix-turn-helix domain